MTKRLLVADDSMIIREIIKTAALKAGWEVVAEAANGLEAIDRYRQTKPDLVTLDLVMPQYDGLYALRGIMEADPTATIVVVSAVEQKAVLKEAFRAGAADFIVKPFDKGALAETFTQLAKAPPKQPQKAAT